MFITQLEFVPFVVAALILYFGMPHKFRKVPLLIINLCFYWILSGNILMLYFPIVFVLTTYFISFGIKPGENTLGLKFGVFFLVFILLHFKYFPFDYNFFITNSIFQSDEFPSQILLPLGISYIVFQGIGYLMDIYWGKVEFETNIINLANYLLFFSKVIAGPVERSYNLLPTLKSGHKISHPMLLDGMRLVAFGLFKKMVISSHLAGLFYFNHGMSFNEVENKFIFLIAFFIYPLYLYADFSGYTDIARGIAKCFGIDLLPNFKNPFYSATITEFWRKWHISLSSWFNEYYFTPISFILRKYGKVGVSFAFFTTFTLLGIWHGTTAGFLVFGLFHGALVLIEFVFKVNKRYNDRSGKAFRIIFVYLLICISFVFFRSPSMNESLVNLSSVFDLSNYLFGFGELKSAIISLGFGFRSLAFISLGILLMEIIHIMGGEGSINVFIRRVPKYIKWSLYFCLIVFILIFGDYGKSDVIYFRF